MGKGVGNYKTSPRSSCLHLVSGLFFFCKRRFFASSTLPLLDLSEISRFQVPPSICPMPLSLLVFVLSLISDEQFELVPDRLLTAVVILSERVCAVLYELWTRANTAQWIHDVYHQVAGACLSRTRLAVCVIDYQSNGAAVSCMIDTHNC